MPTAFGLIGSNPALREHWLRRFLALVIDGIVVGLLSVFITISLDLLILSYWFTYTPLFFGFLLFLYSIVTETLFGGTVGKKMFALRVVAIDRNLDFAHALVRNLPKIHPLFLLLDGLIGAAMEGDPRQRLFDRFAGTTVTRVDQGAYMEEQFRMMQRPMPHPMAVPPPPAPSGKPQTTGAQAATAPGGWPGQAPTQSSWPKHEWDSEGHLIKEMKFCTACGGQLVARGDGKLTCVRCGAVY